MTIDAPLDMRPAAVPSAPINGLLGGLFGSELFWLRRGRLPIGVSIVVIAQRPLTS